MARGKLTDALERRRDARDSKNLFFDENLSAGLPEDYKNIHRQKDGSYAVNLSSQSLDPFMRHADSDSLRKLIRYKYLNIGAPKNVNLLEICVLIKMGTDLFIKI